MTQFTYNTFIDGYKTERIVKKIEHRSRQVNFALQALDAGNGDIHQVLTIYPNEMVLAAWMKVISACPTNATADFGYGSIPDYWGNAYMLDTVGFLDRILHGTKEIDYGLVEDKTSRTAELRVPGASYGDTVIVSPSIDVVEMGVTGYVSAPNIVTLQIANLTGGGLNLAEMNISVFVDKAPLASHPKFFTSFDTLDLKATTDFEDVDIDSGIVEVNALIVRI